jgi:vitamin B12 transporter
MRRFLLSTACLAAMLACAGTAAAATPLQTVVIADERVSPEQITVSATRTGETLVNLTGASVTVLSAEELKTQQTVVLTDILKQVPSLVVTRNGGIGQPASVSLRGGEAGQTVVLIDGVRVNDPSVTDDSAAAALGDLLVNNIDRVEVLRGPQSTLYGSDAIGGVISVVTKRGGDSPFALDATAEGGSFGTFHANVAANGQTGIVEYGAGLNFLTNTGISAADSRNGNHENDGYTNVGADGSVRIHITDSVSADLRGYYTRGHDGFDDGFGGPPAFLVADSAANNTNDLLVGYAGLNADFFDDRFHNRLAILGTDASRTFFDSASDTIHKNFEYFSGTSRFEYQGIVDVDAASGSQITFGAETELSTFLNDNFGVFALFSPPVISGHDRLTGYYAQGQTTLFDQLTLTAGVRLDDDDQFGTHTSYKFNAAWNIPGWDATLRGNVGNAFKAPSLFQEFGPNSNPIAKLKPETATGWEIGVDKGLWDNRVKASLTYFERHTSDQIDFQNCFTPADAPGCPQRLSAFGYYVNLDKTRADGIEAILAADITETLNLKLNYTNMSAINTLTHLDLARRPQNLASGVITWLPLDGATVGASVTYQGKRFNDAANLTPLNANTQVDLFGSYDLTEQWQLFGRIENLFNDRTEQVTGYGVPGLGAYAGIRATL